MSWTRVFRPLHWAVACLLGSLAIVGLSGYAQFVAPIPGVPVFTSAAAYILIAGFWGSSLVFILRRTGYGLLSGLFYGVYTSYIAMTAIARLKYLGWAVCLLVTGAGIIISILRVWFTPEARLTYFRQQN